MKEAYWLSNIPGIGNRLRNRLLEYTGSAGEVYKLTRCQLEKIPGIGEKEIAAIEKSRSADWERAYERIMAGGVHFISTEDKEFPDKLKNIPDAPYSIYYKGKLPDADRRSVAIVGARMCSPYGQAAARKIGETLAKAGIQVISGMAKGIDSAGHVGAISGGGATFAVLGCGVEVCYPASNRSLYEQMIQTGGILSEYPPHREARAGQFPMRNRLISAFSDAVIIVEAKVRSGSLITADCALEQGKDVYAVPGRLFDPLSEGTNALIAQGAGIISDMEELVRELGGTWKEKTSGVKENNQLLLEKDESMVYSCLSLQPKSMSELMEQTGLDAAVLADKLINLCKRGLVKEYFKNYYIRNDGST